MVDWARKFIDENLVLLLAKDNRIESIRTKKKDFFNKHSLKSSDSFSVKEIALGTISYLMRTGKIRSEDDLRKCVESSSFLSEYIMENQIEGLAGLLRPTESKILTTADLGKLNQEGFLGSVPTYDT